MAITTGSDDEDMMSEINVTPLVDVMLVLLTVFIVTAPLLMNAVSVKLPQAVAEAALTQPRTAHISVTRLGEIYLDEAPLTGPQLETELRTAAAQPDLSVEIYADEKAEYGAVAKVMAAIQRAGVVRFSFVLAPETGTGTD